MLFLEAELINFLIALILVFTRIIFLLIAIPVLGTQLLPMRIRISLAFILSIVAITNMAVENFNFTLNLNVIIILMQQAIIGILIGIILHIIFQVFILLGEIISMQSGLGFAILNDPISKTSVPMISQLFLMLITLLFLSLDGHLAVIKLLLQSFVLFPVDKLGFDYLLFKEVVDLGSAMFTTALQIALPAITALLMVNVGFGVMTRAAPQLNIFSIGFPITMILGVIVVWTNISIIHPHFERLLDESLLLISNYFVSN